MMNEVTMNRAAFVAGAGALACALAGCSGGLGGAGGAKKATTADAQKLRVRTCLPSGHSCRKAHRRPVFVQQVPDAQHASAGMGAGVATGVAATALRATGFAAGLALTVAFLASGLRGAMVEPFFGSG